MAAAVEDKVSSSIIITNPCLAKISVVILFVTIVGFNFRNSSISPCYIF
jgi:hypothetical protein